MNAPRLSLLGAGKRYRRTGRRDALRDVIPELIGRALRGSTQDDEFWAVRELNFDVGPGESLAIIGPNGSGKSTALKLLTGVASLTVGSRVAVGRMGAMIELGAAFHPDLTGRENVHLQGTLLGLSRRDVRARFDEIAAFSGIEAFLDTPLRHYSSGMHARLGFAVAAHLEPDVLVIDEVLSVGDWSFQQRAYARLKALVAAGVPCVVVSHQLDRVVDLCARAIVLQAGETIFDGSAHAAVEAYIKSQQAPIAITDVDAPALLEAIALDTNAVASGDVLRFSIPITLRLEPGHSWQFVLLVRSLQSGDDVFSAPFDAVCGTPLRMGRQIIRGLLHAHLAPGLYQIECGQVEVATGGAASGVVTAVFRVSGDQRLRGPAALMVEMKDAASTDAASANQ